MRDNDSNWGGPRLLPVLRRSLRRAGEAALVDGDSPLHVHAPDSLEITRLAVQLSTELGFTVPVRMLFESVTVGDLVSGLEALARRHTPDPPPEPGSGTWDRRRRRRLSFSQERMAFMHAMATGSAAYHVAFGLRLCGPIDVGALTRAIESLPRRYEVLRTRFLPAAEGTLPLPLEHPALTLRVISPQAGGVSGPESELRIATEFCNAPFDLEAGDTARAAVIRSGPDSALLVLVFHHIVMDQWSYELLLDHLSRAYAHEVAGSPPPDTAGDTRFTEYAIRHRAWFRGNAFQADRDYWLKHLQGSARVTFEPDRPRGALPSFRGARWRLALPERTWQQLEELALRERATLSMLLYAALALQLRNESGQDDVVIGLPVANRNHPGAPACFGALVNTLALRTRIDGSRPFVSFLGQVRATFLGALEHQDMPFEVLIGQMRIDRDPSVSPLFGVMLNVLNTPPANIALPNLSVERVEIDRCGAQFDLTLTVDRLHTKSVWFEYATDLYEESTIDRLSQRYQYLLEAILEDPGRALDRLPHRTRAEATQIRRWGAGHAALAGSVTTFDLVAAGAAARMDAPAASCNDRTLTHRELHARAARLAAALRAELGDGPARVGLMVGRDFDLPVALLGALRAGISFVPLDPAFPVERLSFIARDAGLRLILCDGDTAREDWMPPGAALRPLARLLDASTGPAPAAPAVEGREAYVLYTSGTTGQPKGVSVPDHALANFLATMQRRPGIRPGDRLLAVTTLGFDISLLELLLPLTVGACVVIASREEARDGNELAGLIAAQRITLLQATPSTWMQLIEAGWHGNGALRALVGGEPLPRALATALLARTGELWNMYGPTESTVWSTCSRVVDDSAEITIGRPVGGTTVAIVDRQDRPSGIGAHGEILVGGSGLALGYVNQPALTAERFVTLAIDGSTSRFYRTGDLGAWTVGGELRILGRLDRQLKVRGHRIEPEDIEACALRITGISRAHVGVTAASAGDRRLVLYIVLGRPAPDVNAIRARLRLALPEYMIPQLVVPVEALPTLPNGKIDQRRLAQLATQVGGGATPVAAPPRAGDEAVLHQIWSELLGIPRIDRDQDFFELGGHSLLAMQVVTRVREELQKNCTLAQVFRHPTLASLCAALGDSAALTSHTLVPLQEEGEGRPLFCLCGIQLYRPLVRELALDNPVFAAYVPVSGPTGVEALAAEYLAVIRSQQPRGPYRLLGFSLGGVLAFEIARQLLAEGEKVEQLVILDSDVPGGESASGMKGVLRGVRRALTGGDPEARAMPDYLRAIREYRPQRYPGRAVYVEATRADHFEPGYGWPDLVQGLVTLHVDSDHLEMMSRAKAAELARVLRPVLARDPAAASSA